MLEGPRQTGKTSLLERTFPEANYVSLDVGTYAEMAETRPLELLERFPPPLVVDEIQYAPSLLRAIKTVVDRRRGEKGLYLLSGSHSLAVMESVSETLAGRAAVIPLLGLSGLEWSGAFHPESLQDWFDFLWRGSYPGLWGDEPRPPRDRWYQGYVTTYLERDVRNLIRVARLRDFERLLRAAAVRCSQTLNMSELARDVGIAPSTAREWISVLVASRQILLLEPYHRSLGKRLAKSPKLYFTDTGLAAYLMGFESPEALVASPHAGALWECYVVAQWVRWRDWQRPEAGLWYWRDQAGNEVDLLVEHNQRLYPIEIKLAQHPRRPSGGLHRFRELYGDAVKHAFIACTAPAPFDLDPQTTAVPAWTPWELDGPGSSPTDITSGRV